MFADCQRRHPLGAARKVEINMGNPVVIDWDARLPGTIRVGWRVPCDCGEEHEDIWWGNTKNNESLARLLVDIEQKYGKKEVIDLRKSAQE